MPDPIPLAPHSLEPDRAWCPVHGLRDLAFDDEAYAYRVPGRGVVAIHCADCGRVCYETEAAAKEPNNGR